MVAGKNDEKVRRRKRKWRSRLQEEKQELMAARGGIIKTGGPFCTLGATLIGIPFKTCSSDGDCPMPEKKLCCSLYEDFVKGACTGIDSFTMEAEVTITDPSQARA